MFERHALTHEEKARVEVIQKEQTAACRMGTAENLNRKARISVLFSEFDRLTALIDMFRGNITSSRTCVARAVNEHTHIPISVFVPQYKENRI